MSEKASKSCFSSDWPPRVDVQTTTAVFRPAHATQTSPAACFPLLPVLSPTVQRAENLIAIFYRLSDSLSSIPTAMSRMRQTAPNQKSTVAVYRPSLPVSLISVQIILISSGSRKLIKHNILKSLKSFQVRHSGDMAKVVSYSLRHLKPADIHAMVMYLRDVKPQSSSDGAASVRQSSSGDTSLPQQTKQRTAAYISL